MSSAASSVTTVFLGDEAHREVPFLQTNCTSLTVVPIAAGWSASDAAAKVAALSPDILVLKLGTSDPGGIEIVEALRELDAVVFVIMSSATAVGSPGARQLCFNAGVNMVTCLGRAQEEFARALDTVHSTLTSGGPHHCPYCDMLSRGREHQRGGVFTADALWHHMPLYHINVRAPVGRITCSVCEHKVKELQVHVHNAHRPAGAGPPEDKSAQALYAFALAVVRRPSDNKFLIVQEYAGQGFWLPGGRVDAGETFDVAAVRETEEEGGIKIRLTGILSLRAMAYEDGGCRMKMIFLGEPVTAEEALRCKTTPDFESVGSTWASIDDLRAGDLKFRSAEVLDWCGYVADGKPVYPMALMGHTETLGEAGAGGGGGME